MIFNWIQELMSSDLAVDLGTATTLVYVKGKGIVLCEPSVVALREDTSGGQRIVAIGKEAKRMLGKTPPNVAAIRPIRNGVISDFEVTEEMLRYFIKQAHHRNSLARPRMVICVPFGATDVERRAIRESALSAGAREVYLIEEPLAAAIGAGLPISEPGGNLLLDIGGGTTEVAIISLSGIVYTHCVPAAGETFNEAILQYVRRKYNLFIGENMAEQTKIELASAIPLKEPKRMEVKGRDMIVGLPRRILLDSGEVLEAIEETLNEIVDAVKVTLERTQPELIIDVMDRGITLTGGGALLTNLDHLLKKKTGLPVHLARDPIGCVAFGSGRALQELPLLKKVTLEN